jgi:hypothetical protein
MSSESVASATRFVALTKSVQKKMVQNCYILDIFAKGRYFVYCCAPSLSSYHDHAEMLPTCVCSLPDQRSRQGINVTIAVAGCGGLVLRAEGLSQ